MKTMTSRILLSLLAVSLSAGAFADSFSGGGTWKNSQGATGSYTSAVTVNVQADGSKLVTKTITTDTKSHTFTFTLQKVDDTFFQILENGTKVGGGYCWSLDNKNAAAANGKICHWGRTTADHSMVEGTFKFADGVVYDIGSKWDPAAQVKTIWKGSATPASSVR